MLELVSYNEEILNTKQRITIDLLRNGKEFLGQFDINEDLVSDTVSVVHKFLKFNNKVPNNLYKFFIAGYYIISRHPLAFPVHESKQDFCNKFGIKQSSLDYSVNKIVSTLDYVKILDDMNYPYYIDPDSDISLNLIKNIVKSEVKNKMMNFLLYHQPINANILCEELVAKIVLEMKLFPEELFRQLYEIIMEFIEGSMNEYNEYTSLQEKYFI